MTGDGDHSKPGRAWVFGDHIDTDQIAPSRFITSTDPGALGEHAFNDLRPAFSAEVESGDFVVGGKNFGGGSSREQAPLALLGAGVAGIVAESFARIFFRNCINIGLPVVSCSDASEIDDGDTISVRVEDGVVHNHTANEEYASESLPPFLGDIIDNGGLKPYTRAKLEE
jgi:3-isopropylmalate/(R)-2-methylmalate dehydratase small subunit